MHMNAEMADEILEIAVASARQGENDLQPIDELPAAIYITNADGLITYFNPACIAFAGRIPVTGQDRWCVTWKLFTVDGQFLPHDQCPMAVAIRERRAIRGVEAVAERPDGTRRHFRPYPTPLLDADGNLVRAVNMLVDVTHRKRAQSLRAQAVKCRRLAAGLTDQRTKDNLHSLATEYEEQANRLERSN